MPAFIRLTASRPDCSPTKSCRCWQSASQRATAAAPICSTSRFRRPHSNSDTFVARRPLALLSSASRLSPSLAPALGQTVLVPIASDGIREDVYELRLGVVEWDAERRVVGPVMAVARRHNHGAPDCKDH